MTLLLILSVVLTGSGLAALLIYGVARWMSRIGGAGPSPIRRAPTPSREPDLPTLTEILRRSAELAARRSCHDRRCPGFGRHPCHDLDCGSHR